MCMHTYTLLIYYKHAIKGQILCQNFLREEETTSRLGVSGKMMVKITFKFYPESEIVAKWQRQGMKKEGTSRG